MTSRISSLDEFLEKKSQFLSLSAFHTHTRHIGLVISIFSQFLSSLSLSPPFSTFGLRSRPSRNTLLKCPPGTFYGRFTPHNTSLLASSQAALAADIIWRWCVTSLLESCRYSLSASTLEMSCQMIYDDSCLSRKNGSHLKLEGWCEGRRRRRVL